MIYFFEQLLTLLGLTFIGNGLGYIFYYVLLSNTNAHFSGLEHRQKMRAVKNLTKATFLAYLTIYTTPHILALVQTGIWDNDLITWMGNIYVSTDMAGLFYVKSLPTSTKIHHTVVFFLGIMNIIADYGQPGTHRNLVALAYFSLIPYSVNCLLGTKDLRLHPIFYRILAVWSALVYGVCIVCNFVYQHITIFWYNEDWWVIRYGFLSLYYIILGDDQILMKWLAKVARNPNFSDDREAGEDKGDKVEKGEDRMVLQESNDTFEDAKTDFDASDK